MPRTPPPNDDATPLRKIANTIHWARRDAKLTKIQLADQAGVTRYVVGKIEAGEPVVSTALAQVMDALGIELQRMAVGGRSKTSGHKKTQR